MERIDSEPLMSGVGLRTTHYPYLLKRPKTKVDFFEVISENFMATRGRPLAILKLIREDYPIAFHGVSLSIGSEDPVNQEYLKALKELVLEVEPFIISDHLCWTGVSGKNTHDLLPMIYDSVNLQRVCKKISEVQDFLGRSILLENPSSYISFEKSSYAEEEFLVEICHRTGCKILLDINNVYVSCKNLGFDPLDYLNKIPEHLIGQVHLAGFTDCGTHLFDTHSSEVHEEVWKLVKCKSQNIQAAPVLVEWDGNIPEFPILEAEMLKAKEIIKKYGSIKNAKAII